MALAEAAVEITADVSRFGGRLTDSLQKTGAQAAKAFSKSFASNLDMSSASFGSVGRSAGRAGKRAGQAYADGFNRTVGPALSGGGLDAAMSRVAQRAKSAFSSAFGSGLSLDTQGVDYDFLAQGAGPAGERAGINWSQAMRSAIGSALSGIGTAVSSALSGAASAFRGMGKAATSSAAGIAASGAALAVAAGAAVQLGAELSSTLGILAAVPAAIGAMAAVSSTLKVALQGVGAAFGAALGGSAQKFEESLRGLSPAAAQTARDLRALKPALDGLQSAVQQSFFAPLVGQLQSLSAVITGPLQSGMTKLAGLFGKAAAQVVQFASSAQATRMINAIFTSTRKAVSALAPAIGQVVKGFAALATAGASTLPQMAKSIAQVATAFGQWLQRISASGQAVSWIQGAMTTFGQLGRIVMNVGATIAAVFGRITRSGNRILPMLVQATAAMRRFFTSAQGGKAVTATFNALALAARILKVPLQLLGMIFSTVLLPAIRGVMPILRTLAMAVFPVLTKAIALIRPLFVQLGASFRKVLAAARPVVRQIVTFLTPAFQRLVPIVRTVVTTIVSVVQGLFNMLSSTFKLIGAVLRGDWSAAWNALKGILRSAWHVIWSILRGAVQTVWSIITNLGPLLWDAFTAAWNLAKSAVTAGIDAVVGFVQGIPGKIVDVLSGLGNLLYGIGEDILQGLWDGLKSAWNAVSGWIGNIAGWIKNLKGPPSYDRRLLIPAGEAIMNGLDQGLRDGYSRVRSTLAGITTDIPSVQVPVSMGSPGRPERVQPRPIGAGRGRARGAGGGVAAGASGGVSGGGSATTVHAPITVTTPATDPEIVARKTADRLARAAQA